MRGLVGRAGEGLEGRLETQNLRAELPDGVSIAAANGLDARSRPHCNHGPSCHRKSTL